MFWSSLAQLGKRVSRSQDPSSNRALGGVRPASPYLQVLQILDIVTDLIRPEIEDNPVAKTASKSPRKTVRDEKSEFGKDRRRRHHHFLVTVNYADGETFGRVYTDKDKATRFAERQRRSPIVKSARVTQVS
jgi:hypothetical protein